MQLGRHGSPLLGGKAAAARGAHPVGDAPLDAFDGGKARIDGNVGGLGGPGGNGADAGRHQEQFQVVAAFLAVTLFEQSGQLAAGIVGQGLVELHEVPVVRFHPGHGGHGSAQSSLETLQTESGKGGSATQEDDVGHGISRGSG